MRTIKSLVFFTALFILPAVCISQNLHTSIKLDAMQMGNALIKNDFDGFVKYIHPKAITLAGGKEQMKSKMDTVYMGMKRFGAGIKRYWIGQPGEIFSHNNQLQATVPQQTTMSIPIGDVVVETTLIAVSNNKGKNWLFIDTNLFSPEKLKELFPELSPKLVIPARKKPTIIPRKQS